MNCGGEGKVTLGGGPFILKVSQPGSRSKVCQKPAVKTSGLTLISREQPWGITKRFYICKPALTFLLKTHFFRGRFVFCLAPFFFGVFL